MDIQLVRTQIADEIGRLQKALLLIEGDVETPRRGRPKKVAVPHRAEANGSATSWTPERRAAQALVMKRNWRKRKAAK